MNMVEDKAYDIADEFALEQTPPKQWDLEGMKNSAQTNIQLPALT